MTCAPFWWLQRQQQRQRFNCMFFYGARYDGCTTACYPVWELKYEGNFIRNEFSIPLEIGGVNLHMSCTYTLPANIGKRQILKQHTTVQRLRYQPQKYPYCRRTSSDNDSNSSSSNSSNNNKTICSIQTQIHAYEHSARERERERLL